MANGVENIRKIMHNIIRDLACEIPDKVGIHWMYPHLLSINVSFDISKEDVVKILKIIIRNFPLDYISIHNTKSVAGRKDEVEKAIEIVDFSESIRNNRWLFIWFYYEGENCRISIEPKEKNRTLRSTMMDKVVEIFDKYGYHDYDIIAMGTLVLHKPPLDVIEELKKIPTLELTKTENDKYLFKIKETVLTTTPQAVTIEFRCPRCGFYAKIETNDINTFREFKCPFCGISIKSDC